MVRLHTPMMQANNDAPIMPKHQLKAIAKTKTFKKDEVALCFISKMSDGRYAIMDTNFSNVTKHYEVFTLEDLHKSFEEIEILTLEN